MDNHNFGRRQPGRFVAAATKLSFAAIALACPRTAFAQDSSPVEFPGGLAGLFGTRHGDISSAHSLNSIFGALFPAESGSVSSTAVSVLAGHLNVAVLAIGGLLFTWSLMAGVLQSAHEGEVLGRRWSSLWAPLRVVFAVALLIPVPGLGGYNSVQAGVAWIVKGSTMMASELWGLGAGLLMSGELPISGVSARFDGELLKTVYRNQLCVRLANHQLEAAGSTLRVQFDQVEARDSVRIISSLGGRNPEICGAYGIPNVPEHLSEGKAGTGSDIEREFRNLHAGMLEIVIDGSNRAISRQWPAILANEPEIPDITGDIRETLERANDRLRDGNRRLVGIVAGGDSDRSVARKAIGDYMTGGCTGGAGCGQGWIGAGNWHMTLARLNSELMGLMNASITADESGYVSDNWRRLNRQVVAEADGSGRFSWLFGGADVNKYLHVDEADRIWTAANAGLDAAAVRLAPLGMGLPGRIIEDASPAGPTGLLGRIWRVGFADEIELLVGMLSPSGLGRDPIVGLVNMGNWFLEAAGVLIFGGATVSLLSGGAGSMIVFLIAAPMAAIGVTQSFVIPLLPFIYWILGIAGYFLLVAEAVVAATLWALMHFRLDGDGISGDAGRQGWLMLLALVLTPALMILGYFLGMVIYRVVAGLLDLGMHHAMGALVSASPIVGIFGLIAAGFLSVLSHTVIIERSFSLISDFPDRILKWIGAAAGVGDGSGERQFRASASMMSSSAASATRQLGRLSPARGPAPRTAMPLAD